MEQLSNRALISRLFSSAEFQLESQGLDSSNWSQWYAAVQDLTGPEKMVYVIVKMNQTVTSGGFSEFYKSSFGIFAPEVIHALTETGARSSADIVSDSLPIVNPKGLLDEAYKAFVFNIELSDQQQASLYALDMRYDQLQDVENLEDLLGAYLQKLVEE